MKLICTTTDAWLRSHPGPQTREEIAEDYLSEPPRYDDDDVALCAADYDEEEA